MEKHASSEIGDCETAGISVYDREIGVARTKRFESESHEHATTMRRGPVLSARECVNLHGATVHSCGKGDLNMATARSCT